MGCECGAARKARDPHMLGVAHHRHGASLPIPVLPLLKSTAAARAAATPRCRRTGRRPSACPHEMGDSPRKEGRRIDSELTRAQRQTRQAAAWELVAVCAEKHPRLTPDGVDCTRVGIGARKSTRHQRYRTESQSCERGTFRRISRQGCSGRNPRGGLCAQVGP